MNSIALSSNDQEKIPTGQFLTQTYVDLCSAFLSLPQSGFNFCPSWTSFLSFSSCKQDIGICTSFIDRKTAQQIFGWGTSCVGSLRWHALSNPYYCIVYHGLLATEWSIWRNTRLLHKVDRSNCTVHGFRNGRGGQTDRDKESECVCVCVRERERERERTGA